MSTRPYTVEVRPELDYLEQVIRELRWKDGAATNKCRLFEETFAILADRCRLVTFHSSGRCRTGYFPFDPSGRRHRAGTVVTVRVFDTHTLLTTTTFEKKYHYDITSGRDIPVDFMRAPPLSELYAEKLLATIHELLLAEVMDM